MIKSWGAPSSYLYYVEDVLDIIMTKSDETVAAFINSVGAEAFNDPWNCFHRETISLGERGKIEFTDEKIIATLPLDGCTAVWTWEDYNKFVLKRIKKTGSALPREP